jgi:Zn-dependent protease with chaperone function
MTTKPYAQERTYFAFRIIFSVVGAFSLVAVTAGLTTAAMMGGAAVGATFFIFALYIVLIAGYFWLLKILAVGHLKGNGIQITEKQFPQATAMTAEVASLYGMKRVPKVFILQSGGVLNAYATRFAGSNFVALYSEVFSVIENDPQVLKFILAHEMAHVKRAHVQKRFWTFLSFWVPFLGAAYSRACEYTCDSFAAEAAPRGAPNGLVLLAAGKDLYRKVNVEEYLASFKENNTDVVRFSQLLSSHPHLPKRIAYLASLVPAETPVPV